MYKNKEEIIFNVEMDTFRRRHTGVIIICNILNLKLHFRETANPIRERLFCYTDPESVLSLSTIDILYVYAQHTLQQQERMRVRMTYIVCA